MHPRLTAILLSAVLSFTACNRGRGPVAPTRELTTDEYGVFSAYFAETFTGQKGEELTKDGIIKIVVSNTTSSGDDDLLRDENGRPVPWEKTAESLRKEAPALQQATINAFQKANTQQALLRRSLQPSIDYELVDPARLQSFFIRNGGMWPAYYKEYPGSQGILTLSRIGFSGDGTQALFYMSNRCGGLCGGGSYVLMEKRSGRWLIGKEIEMWVS